jgi:signal transduction histidine kinase
VVRRWLLPTLSEILAKTEPTALDPLLTEPAPLQPAATMELFKAEQQWQSAVHALGYLLHILMESVVHQPSPGEIAGLLLCSPVPLFNAAEIISQFPTVIFSPAHPHQTMLPAPLDPNSTVKTPPHISLLPVDPLQNEQFCVVLTAQFGLVLSVNAADEAPQFQFSFDPADVNLAWQSLRGRIMLTAPHHLEQLDAIVSKLPPVVPAYQWVMQFSQLLLQELPVMKATALASPEPKASTTLDVELLQALTHEIRTPLTTIRTLTRSVLRRPDLEPQITKRLETIDRECTEQINRMELIFQAVELASNDGEAVDLTTMSFSHLLEQSLPLWQQQAERRNLNMAVAMPQQLPAVVSNPTILDRVLTGLVENFTRNLPAGSHIQVEVNPVGGQLKLQLQSVLAEVTATELPAKSLCGGASEAIGQLLSFQPETGNLSLSLKVTKSLFHILGGKLVVKQNHLQGETMTIFLPMDEKSSV